MSEDFSTDFGVVYYKSEYECVRITYNQFRKQRYVHIRQYYLDILGEWCPTDKGVSVPANEVDFMIEGLNKISLLQANHNKPTRQLSFDF